MGSNSQDDNNQKKGPWGRKDDNDKNRGEQKPKSPWDQKQFGGRDGQPDLDALLGSMQENLNKMFKSSPPGGGASGGGTGKRGFALGAIVLIIWLATGFYRVLPEENAVILTFGEVTSTRGEAGLGYSIPWPVQTVVKVNVAFDRRIEVGFRGQPSSRISENAPQTDEYVSESQMLTGDENIVDIDFVVMWKIGDAKNYLFQIRDPETTIKKVAESAMREMIGRNKIQKALTEGRTDIEVHAKELMQKMMDEYKSGIIINSVQLLNVNPPATVVDAFDDVQRARADKERTKNEAETYSNDIVPRARGDAQKLIQDAEAYKDAVISKAKGDAARFVSVYKAYAEAKDVTGKRLYIETMQQLMKNSKSVVVSDGKTSSILPYLPLDQAKQKQTQ